MPRLRKLLLFSHRYLGIAVSLLVVMWFVSGIVMMYAGGLPRLSPEMRLERAEPIDLAKVHLTPLDAATKASSDETATLVTLLGRPAYRFASAVVFADNGEMPEQFTTEQARAIAGSFLNVPVEKVRYLETLEDLDQWTLQVRDRPLYKFAAEDGVGSEIYIQPFTGAISGYTTSKTRLLSWFGVIPHWFYFTALRENQPLWFKILVWTSAAACVLAVIGLFLGASLFRRPKPFKLSTAIPYRGWMRWHYVTGMVFGLFTVTWAFSGFLSMEPFEWTRAEGLQVPRDAFNSGPAELSAFAKIDPAKWNELFSGRTLKEVTYARIDGNLYYDLRTTGGEALVEKRRERLHQPYYITGRAEPNRMLISAATFEVRDGIIPVETLIAKLGAAVPDTKIVEHELLADYDDYYYSRGRITPLPVLRVKFADPGQTWVYIDPQMGQVLSAIPRFARIERWLYNGLHSLDFSFWYNKRPLWDIGMLTLLTGGLISSMIGLFFGIKRLKRGVVS
jgi:uncharacterized iron-regulated membrane protein